MPSEHLGLPESNAAEVARRLVLRATDLNEAGLADALRLLLDQVEELQRVHRRATEFDLNPPADPIAERVAVLGAYQEALYEPVCIEWFLSRAMKELAEHLEYRVNMSQRRLRPIASITYTETGQLESYRLRSPEGP